MAADLAQRNLVAAILRAHHGEACAAVGDILLKRCDGVSLKELERLLDAKHRPSARLALAVLAQHGCVVARAGGAAEPQPGDGRKKAPRRRRPDDYRLDADAVLAVPRRARTLAAARGDAGDDAAAVLEHLMDVGVASTATLALCLGAEHRGRAERALEALAARALVVPAFGSDAGAAPTAALFEAEEARSAPRTPDDARDRFARDMAASLKAARGAADGRPNGRKRPRDEDAGDGRCWRPGAFEARRALLRESCVSLVGRKLNPVMRRIGEALFGLRAVRWPRQRGDGSLEPDVEAGETEADVADRRRAAEDRRGVGVGEIHAELRKTGAAVDKATIARYLEALQYDQVAFVSKLAGGRGDDRFLFEAARCLDHVRRETLHALLVDRYDAESARLHRVLMRHDALEQGDLAERALLPPKDARERLYRMFDAGLVTFAEVAKAPDKPGANVFLWAVRARDAYAVALADARAAMAALYARRAFEYQDKGKGLVDEDFDDPEGASTAQWSAGDKKRLAAFAKHADRIDRALLQLDAGCAIFEEP